MGVVKLLLIMEVRKFTPSVALSILAGLPQSVQYRYLVQRDVWFGNVHVIVDDHCIYRCGNGQALLPITGVDNNASRAVCMGDD